MAVNSVNRMMFQMCSCRSRSIMLRSTPVHTFAIFPLAVALWELLVRHGRLRLRPGFLPLLAWGYLEYRLCGAYRLRLGGGGPGLERPPERLVTTGPYGLSRNPMYLGHVVYMLGVVLALGSPAGALALMLRALWFHRRVRRDEERMARLFGPDYERYRARVSRWLPGVF